MGLYRRGLTQQHGPCAEGTTPFPLSFLDTQACIQRILVILSLKHQVFVLSLQLNTFTHKLFKRNLFLTPIIPTINGSHDSSSFSPTNCSSRNSSQILGVSRNHNSGRSLGTPANAEGKSVLVRAGIWESRVGARVVDEVWGLGSTNSVLLSNK